MILTCPACATRYFVDEGAIPVAGRTVRCASCSNSWFATRESLADAELKLAAPAEDSAWMSEPEPALVDEPEIPLPRRMRAQAVAKKKTREAVAAGVVWAVLSAAFVVVVIGAVLFKDSIVEVWPSAAGAYAAAKMPVNPVGLVIEGSQGGQGLQDGRAALIITGRERNVKTTAREPQPLIVGLFDKTGKRLATQRVVLPPGPIAPGDSKPFSVSFFDPPLNVAEFGVDFDFNAKGGKAAGPEALAKKDNAAALNLRGPAGAPAPAPTPPPAEAKPLPANSPYALPPAAAAQGHGR
jgi:predicted Zn finger-like uncharacterized protein